MSKLAAALSGQKEVTPYERFRAQVERLRPEIAALVGKENVDRFVRVCLNAVQANPAVLSADRKSLLLASMRAAQDRLLPDGREAVFNIYKTKVKQSGGRDEWIEQVQYLPMVGGLVKKLYESGQATFVDAVAVYEKDEFDYQRGDEPRIIHRPYSGDEDPGKVTAAYVVVKLKNGEVKREVMFRRDIEKVRESSKAKDGPGWTTWYDQFSIKSVIKRAYKQVPHSYELDRAIAADNAAIGIEDATEIAPETGRDLEALVDGRFDQEIRDAALRQGSQQVASPMAAGPSGSAAPEKTQKTTERPELPSAGQSERDGYIASFAECKDSETLALKRDEANLSFTWTKPDASMLDEAYRKRMAELEG